MNTNGIHLFVGIMCAVAILLLAIFVVKLFRIIIANIRKKYEKRIDIIKKDYPLAYQKYIKDHNIPTINTPISHLKELSQIPTESWNKEEINIKYLKIQRNYPKGLKLWQSLSPRRTKERAIEEENDIKNYDQNINQALLYNEWENQQVDFSKECRRLGLKIMPHFDHCSNNIPIEKLDNYGRSVKAKYPVVQFFASSYCDEKRLDYTYFSYIKQNTKNIKEYKNRSRCFPPYVYKDVKDFINKLAETHNISVYLCSNNKEWDAKSLNYHYSSVDGATFQGMNNPIEIYDSTTDVSSYEEDCNYDEYPSLINKHIIIFEMQTDTAHLMEVCKNIVEKNKDKRPLITYISLLKGYDRDEMSKKIADKYDKIAKEERKKEEERQLLLKKQSIENSIQQLSALVKSNDIEQIESTIYDISKCIDLVTAKDQEEFERIRIDYKHRKELGIPQNEELLYVNYNTTNTMDNGNYAIVRMPTRGCIVWPYRRRAIARRGYTESNFEKELYHYLTPYISVLGDVNILPQDGVRPYEPDIALVYSKNGIHIRIDVEIDEPYAAITNIPTHYIGCGDDYRDANLNSLGWIVIRLSERQVVQQTLQCVKFIAELIKRIDNSFNIPKLSGISALMPDKQWTRIECQKMASDKVRQKYLNHEFGHTEESVYNIKDLKLTSFETSLLDKVKPTYLSKSIHQTAIIEDDFHNDNNSLYNLTNRFGQDEHIKFDAYQHIYTIDGIQYKSVSSVISNLFNEFDTKYWSTIKGEERGAPPQQIIEEWDSKGQQSREVGTFLHQQIENYFLHKQINYTYHYAYQGIYVHENSVIDIKREFSFFKDFLSKTIINPYRSEWRIYDKSLKLAGTIDMISVNTDGSYSIYDWKRSSTIYDNNPYHQHGLGRLSHLKDTRMNHYFLQQNLYRYILEHQYGLKIKYMKLVVLHPVFFSYDVIDVPRMDNEVSIIIQTL